MRPAVFTTILLQLPGLLPGAGPGRTASSGGGLPRAENMDNDGRTTRNGPSSAAQPGGLVRLTIEGRVKRHAEIRIGPRSVSVIRHRQLDGALEVTFRIPVDAPAGCNVPVHLALDGVPMRDSMPIAIGSCEGSPHQPLGEWFQRKLGVALRIRETEWLADASRETVADTVVGGFFEGGSNVEFGPLLYLPPEGMCATHAGPYDPSRGTLDIILPLLLERQEGMGLDAGSYLGLDDGRTRVNLPARGQAGLYLRTFARNPGSPPPVSLDSMLRLRGPGGADAGRFSVPLPPPEEFTWLNRPQSGEVRLRSGLPLRWRTQATGAVILAAVFLDPIEGELTYCLCAASAVGGRFDIPKRLLALARPARNDGSAGAIVLMLIPSNPRVFHAAGLARGVSYSIPLQISKHLFTW